MKQYLKPGRIIAFVLSSTLVFMLWGVIYQPGGLGSNILLILVIAGMIIHSATKNFGAFLDDLLFEEGSREKAFLMRRARNELKTFREKLSKSSKRLRASKTHELSAFENALNDLEKQTLSARPNLRVVNGLLSQVDKTALAFLGKLPRRGLVGGFESLVIALLGAIALRVFLIEPYQIPSGSMIPTLLVGDHLFVSKLSYGIANPFARTPSYWVRWSNPKPGDVMIFEAPPYVPNNAGATWIKRVIAGPGQKVSIKNAVVHVDDVPYAHIEKDNLVQFYDYYMGYNFWRQETEFRNIEDIPGKVQHQIYMRNLEEVWPEENQPELPGLSCDKSSCTVQEGFVFVMGDNRGGSADGRMWGALPIDNIKGKALFIWMSVDGRQEWFSLGRFSLPKFRWERWFKNIR